MKCRLCGNIGEIFRGMVDEEYLIIYPGGTVLRDVKRDVYIAVELTSRPTIRVMSHF